MITGPTGVGKTYLACALAHAAIRNGHTALYLRAPRMLDELAIARGDGRLARLLAAWARIGVLVIDDLLLRPLTSDQAADLLEVIEDRAGLRATIVTSQLPVAMWHEAIGDPTIADAALDRLLGQRPPHRAVRRVHAPGPRRRPRPRTTAGPVMSGHPRPAIPRTPRSHDHAPTTASNSCFEVTPGYRRPGRGR